MGVPLVSTWQPCAGLLFEQTFVEVNPPTGKLKDCADAAGVVRVLPIKRAARMKPKQNLLRILFSP